MKTITIQLIGVILALAMVPAAFAGPEAAAPPTLRPTAEAQPAKRALRPGLIGDDDRVILADEPALRAVGRLNRAGSGFCTATLIAPDRIATAAHCLFHPRTGAPIASDRLHFLAGYRKGAYVAHRIIADRALHPRFSAPAPRTIGAVSTDIAVLTLAQPIAATAATPIALARPLAAGAAVALVSYARDRAELPSIQDDCVALDVKDGVAWTTCDVNFGASGGPLLIRDEAEWRLAGVVSGFARQGDKAAMLAVTVGDGLVDGAFQ